MRVAVTFTRLDERAQAPRQAHPGEDAGWDLAALESVNITGIRVNDKPVTTWVRTGIAVSIPRGHYGRIVGRSSTATKGLHVIEGVIDSGYRGELLIRVCPMWESGDAPAAVRVPEGQALAQLIVTPVPSVDMIEVGTLPESERGENGFGSSDRLFDEAARPQVVVTEPEPEVFREIREFAEQAKAELRAHESGQRYEAQRNQDGDMIEFTLPADPVARDLFAWWIHTSFEDFMATVPKMLEYGGHSGRKGSADLRIVGEGLMELLGWEVTEETSRVAQELGCWFYDLGKGGRLVSDFQQRRPGKPDTWFDKSIYAMMARRIQTVGTWP